jgi:hypothetical protein
LTGLVGPDHVLEVAPVEGTLFVRTLSKTAEAATEQAPVTLAGSDLLKLLLRRPATEHVLPGAFSTRESSAPVPGGWLLSHADASFVGTAFSGSWLNACPSPVTGIALGRGQELTGWLESFTSVFAGAHLETRWARHFEAPAVRKAKAAIAGHLSNARRATGSRDAYRAFERAARVVEMARAPAMLERLLVYVADRGAPFRDTLLSCIADRELPLDGEPTIRGLLALLADDNREVARSAALALESGGSASSAALFAALPALSEQRRGDLKRLLSFAGGR